MYIIQHMGMFDLGLVLVLGALLVAGYFSEEA